MESSGREVVSGGRMTGSVAFMAIIRQLHVTVKAATQFKVILLYVYLIASKHAAVGPRDKSSASALEKQ
jgi:hypothetical protein